MRAPVTGHVKGKFPFFYRPPGGGRLFDMKVVSSYVFLRSYYDSV